MEKEAFSEEYVAPEILLTFRHLFDVLRRDYSRDFAFFITSAPGSNDYKSYRAGLVFIACVFAGLLFIWSFILLWLQINGKHVGCASGRAFEPERRRKNRSRAEGVERSSLPPRQESLQSDAISLSSSIPSDYDNELAAYSFPHIRSDDDYKSDNEEEEGEEEGSRPSRRETRTQMCFFFFSLATLVCVPLILVYFFKPLFDATNESSIHLDSTRNILREANDAMSTVSAARIESLSIMSTLPVDITKICPNATSAETEAVLGVNLDSPLELLRNNFTKVLQQTSRDISQVQDLLEYFGDGVDGVDSFLEASSDYLWIFPVILFSLSALTTVTIAAVYFAAKRQSTLRFQRFISYGVLPVLLLLSLACWAIGLGSIVATAVGTDICLSGSPSGSPNETIAEIIQAQDFNEESPLYKYVTAYTDGCHQNDPKDQVYVLQGEVTIVVDFLDQSLAKALAVGEKNLDNLCGGGDDLIDFLAGALSLARKLTSIQQALGDGANALACERVHPLYNVVVNDLFCIETTSATSWGFVLFLALGVTTMGMITLRASWRHKIREERIYKESEVAENMIVDEHEEYLEYISRYKHEWEEYQGLGAFPTQPIQGGEFTQAVERSSSTVSGGDDSSDSTEQDPDGEEQRQELLDLPSVQSREEAFDPYTTDSRSEATNTSGGNISFLSLQEAPSPKDNKQFSMPPSLLQPIDAGNSSPPPIDSLDSSPHSHTYVDNLKKDLHNLCDDNNDAMISAFGAPVCLSDTAKKHVGAHPGSVQFQLVDETPASHVQANIELFSNPKIERPRTPTRKSPARIRNMVARYDSPRKEMEQK